MARQRVRGKTGTAVQFGRHPTTVASACCHMSRHVPTDSRPPFSESTLFGGQAARHSWVAFRSFRGEALLGMIDPTNLIFK